MRRPSSATARAGGKFQPRPPPPLRSPVSGDAFHLAPSLPMPQLLFHSMSANMAAVAFHTLSRQTPLFVGIENISSHHRHRHTHPHRPIGQPRPCPSLFLPRHRHNNLHRPCRRGRALSADLSPAVLKRTVSQ